MDKINASIHRMSEQLEQIKEMFQTPSIDKVYEYYEKELYKKPHLEDITNQVNELFLSMMIETLKPIKCTIKRNDFSDVPIFTIKSEMLEDFATVELYEKFIVINRNYFSSILKDRDVATLVKYTSHLEKVSTLLKEQGFEVVFN